MKREITQKLAMLNPEKNYGEIMYLLQCYDYPWDYERALEFALFRTYAVPSISALLYKTGEFVSRPRDATMTQSLYFTKLPKMALITRGGGQR